MIPALKQLILKELRLQRGVMAFAAATTVLGVVMLFMISANPGSLGGFAASDIQMALLLCGLMPALLIILPAMIGSTAAAAERPLGVPAWQLALPVPRWQIVGVKAGIVVVLCALTGGVLLYPLQWISLEPDLIPTMLRDLWPGWHAILFGAIGFFAGSFAKDDYHGLLLSLIPAVVVVAALGLSDPTLRVQAVLPFPTAYPALIILRLLLISALLIALVAPLHCRLIIQTWRRMAVSLAFIAVVIFVLTLININLEGRVIAGPANKDFPAVENLPDHVQSAKVTEIGTVIRGVLQAEDGEFTEPDADFMATVTYPAKAGLTNANDPDWNPEKKTGTFITISGDGHVRQFPQVLADLNNAAGWSPDQKWALSREAHFLCGPYGFTIPLVIFPDALADRIMDAVNIELRDARSLAFPASQLHKLSADDIYRMVWPDAGVVWKDGKKDIPASLKPELHSILDGGLFSAYMVVAAGSGKQPTTVTAILKPTNERGFFRPTGFVKGTVRAVSKDGQWVRLAVPQNILHRKVASWTEAMESDNPIPTGVTWYSDANTKALDDGTTFVDGPLYPFSLDVVSTPDGPAAVHKYVLVEDIQMTTSTLPDGNIIYDNTYIIRDFGLSVVNLETGESTNTSLRLPNEDRLIIPETRINAIPAPVAAALHHFKGMFDADSKTVHLHRDSIGRFARLDEAGRPVFRSAVMNSRGGRFIGGGKMAMAWNDSLWIVEP